MPIYEYQCQACGNEHEAIQKMSADPLIECPVCNKPELKKKISAAGFRLKGSGKKNASEPSKSKAAPTSAKKSGSCGSGGCGHQH